ncbi:MAG: hypothetical protein ACR2MB_12160 [Acidimicrobiales bacterium]
MAKPSVEHEGGGQGSGTDPGATKEDEAGGTVEEEAVAAAVGTDRDSL